MKKITLIAFIKHSLTYRLSKWLKEGSDALDKIYKFLRITKLLKELGRAVFTTKDEEKV